MLCCPQAVHEMYMRRRRTDELHASDLVPLFMLILFLPFLLNTSRCANQYQNACASCASVCASVCEFVCCDRCACLSSHMKCIKSQLIGVCNS